MRALDIDPGFCLFGALLLLLLPVRWVLSAVLAALVHELCHLIEMNHSPAFWAQVEKHCPDYKKWRDYLKRGISSPFE